MAREGVSGRSALSLLEQRHTFADRELREAGQAVRADLLHQEVLIVIGLYCRFTVATLAATALACWLISRSSPVGGLPNPTKYGPGCSASAPSSFG